MEIIPACYENLKKFLRRRKYKRLNNFGNVYNNKRKLKVVRLGGSRVPQAWKTGTTVSDLGLSVVSPLKFLARFHDAYVAMMMRRDGSNIRRVSIGDEVHEMLDLEIYKRLVVSGDVGHS